MALTVTPAELTATALTLTTAAQPNITSVGTLSGLTTAGITMSNGGDRVLTGPLNQSLLINARPNDATEGLKLQINTSNKLSILQNGSIVIGGAGAPRTVGWGDTKLQIEGTGATDSSISLIRNEAGNNPPYFVFAKSRTGSIGSNTVVQDDDYLGVLRFNGADGTDLGNSAAQIHVEVDGTPATDDVPGALVFSTNAIGDGSSAASEKLRIAAGGNVGIGTNNPGAKLEIKATRSSGANATALILHDNVTGVQTTGYGTRIEGRSNNNNAVSAIGFEAFGGSNNDTAISFYTQNVAGALARKMIINDDGKVGIGTATPFAQLQIYNAAAGAVPLLRTMSHATAAGSFSGDYSVEFRHATSTVTHAMLVSNAEANDSRRTLDVADSNGVFASFVNGKVGIGETSPASKLHITTGNSAGEIRLSTSISHGSSGGTNNRLSFYNTANSASEMGSIRAVQHNQYTYGNIDVYVNNANTLALNTRFHYHGHVTINTATTASNSKLNVNGGIRFIENPASAGGLNVVSSQSFNNSNTANNCGAVYYRCFVINIYHNNGNSQCFFVSNGGGGVGFNFTGIVPGNTSLVTGTGINFSFTTIGDNAMSFTIDISSGGGVLTVNRTSGSNSFLVSVSRLG